MELMIENFFNGGNKTLAIVCLALASIRIYLEIVGFDFLKLPLTKKLSVRGSHKSLKKFHRNGLILCIGYILFTAPGIILN